jgi:putative transposase
MKKELILNNKNSSLSVRKQCELMNVSRSRLYYKPLGEKPENLEIMQIMDKHILEELIASVFTVKSKLLDQGIKSGYESVRRLIRKANIRPIYPRRHLTVLGEKNTYILIS